MKTCSKCKLEKSLEEFNKNKSKKDGLQTICQPCSRLKSKAYYSSNIEYHRKAVRARSIKYRKELLQYVYNYLLEHPCVDCGEKDPVVLEFDHIGEKIKCISEMIANNLSIKTITSEIEKCEVRCANCHKRKNIPITKNCHIRTGAHLKNYFCRNFFRKRIHT